jgi:hypothetical protein
MSENACYDIDSASLKETPPFFLCQKGDLPSPSGMLKLRLSNIYFFAKTLLEATSITGNTSTLAKRLYWKPSKSLLLTIQ